jgi:hypothetical protein
MPTPPKKKPDVRKAPPKKIASKKSPHLKAQTPPKEKVVNAVRVTREEAVANKKAAKMTATKPNKGMVRRAASATPIYDSVVREKGFDPLGPKKKR